MSKLRIALAQLECADGHPERNLDKVSRVMREAGPNHDVVVFPEGYITGFPSASETRALAEPLAGPIVQQLTAIAREAQGTLFVGMTELADDTVYNTSVMVGPEGLFLAYRKTHLWVGEALRVTPGNTYVARDWKDTRVGLLICYDVEFPETARAVASLGSELILLTNGNMEPYGRTHRRAITTRAQENQVYMAMANRVGYQGTIRYVGESCVADPYGELAGELTGDHEGLLSVEVDMEMVRDSRGKYDYLKERRISLDLSDMHLKGETYTLTLNS